MPDVHSIDIRSKNMSAIKSRGNKSTENKFLVILKSNRIKGWRRHYRRIYGKPDFSFQNEKLAIFLDGCFWHKCPQCYKSPKSNIKFWENKIDANQKRDQIVNNTLELKGWRLMRIWEHELKSAPEIVLANLNKLLNPRE